MHAADEVVEHLLGDVEVGDDAILERPDGHDIGWRATDHPFGLGAHGEYLPGSLVYRDDGWLVDYHALVPNEDQSVGGPQVDTYVPGHQAKNGVYGAEHGFLPGRHGVG